MSKVKFNKAKFESLEGDDSGMSYSTCVKGNFFKSSNLARKYPKKLFDVCDPSYDRNIHIMYILSGSGSSSPNHLSKKYPELQAILNKAEEINLSTGYNQAKIYLLDNLGYLVEYV